MKRVCGFLTMAMALLLVPASASAVWEFDELDADPDTNWQPYVVNTSADCDSCPNLRNAQGGNAGDGSGNVLWIQNNHQGDATEARHDYDNFGRDAFLKFSKPAMPGDVITGSFRMGEQNSQAGWVLTSDIEAMLQDTADVGPTSSQHHGDAKHHPLTKWTVGFGETLNALDRGIKIEQPESYYASVIVAGTGHGCCGSLQAWGPVDGDAGRYSHVELESASMHDGSTPLGPVHKFNPEGNSSPFLYEFELTVGESAYSSFNFTIENGGYGPGPIVDFGEMKVSHDGRQEGGAATGDPVPVTNAGVDKIEGIVWTDTGPKQPQFWIDDISISINGEPVAVDNFEDDIGATNDDTLSGRTISNFGPGDATGAGFFPTTDVGEWLPNRYNVAKMTVPEPATLALIGLGGLMLVRRRRA